MSFERVNLNDFYTVERTKKKRPFSWFSKDKYNKSYKVKGKNKTLKLDESTRVHFDRPKGTKVRVKSKGREIAQIGGPAGEMKFGVVLPAGKYKLEMSSET